MEVASDSSRAAWDALCKSQAVIEFELSGAVIWANDVFLSIMGYRLEEIAGRHHSMFCRETYARTSDYARFWDRLRDGQFESGLYRRISKNGADIWLQATYNPVLDASGRPARILKFASDVTEAQQRGAEHESKIAAIMKSLSVVELSMDGIILDANDNFLADMGYARSEVIGDRKSTRLNSSHTDISRMPSSA